MRKPLVLVGITLFVIAFLFVFSVYLPRQLPVTLNPITNEPLDDDMRGGLELVPHPLSIEALRLGDYPGSDIVIEQTLTPGSNYQRFIASYKSEGLKIFGLLTVPNGEAPDGGYPTIIFNHGYIQPAQYRTTEKYIAYTDGFSKNGYVLFRPDYRGHGNSEGQPTGAYGSNGYTIDILNATASVKKLEYVNPERIGMWGHSMGGHITLRNMVVSKDVKVGVIWAGVVASYEDLFDRWRRRNTPSSPHWEHRGSWRQSLSDQYGEPNENGDFWNSLSANSFLSDISGPIQLHHGTADSSVPYRFSETLDQELKNAGKDSELYLYSGDDHNISTSFGNAMARSIDFFDKFLK